MKLFFQPARRRMRLGFSLAEAALSVGILSFGFLGLAPMLGEGLQSARQGRDARISAQIAETLADQAQEGTPTAGTAWCDDEGAACPSSRACYQAMTTLTAGSAGCTCLTIQITPLAHPTRPLAYAVVLPPQ